MKAAILFASTVVSLFVSSKLFAQDQTPVRQASIAVKQLGAIEDREGGVIPMWVIPALYYEVIGNQNPQCEERFMREAATYGKQTTLSSEFQMLTIPIVERIVQERRGEGRKKISCSYKFSQIGLRYGIRSFVEMWTPNFKINMPVIDLGQTQNFEIQTDFQLESIGWHGVYPHCISGCEVSLNSDLNAAIIFHNASLPLPPKSYNGISTKKLRERQATIKDESPNLPLPSAGEAPAPPSN